MGMERNECNIIRDLLPLYAEGMVSPDTADLVSEHLKVCETCRQEYARAKEPQPPQEELPGAPLLKISRKIRGKRIRAIALTAVFLLALFVSVFAVLDAPIYLPYSEETVTVEELGDKGILLKFDEEVTDFDYTVSQYPDGEGEYRCEIQAWTSLWDKWFSKGKGRLTATVTTQQTKPVAVVYVPNNGNENVQIARYDPDADAGTRVETLTGYDGTVALPRLSLGYYFVLAAAALAVSGVAWLLTRRKADVRVWVERAGLYPVAYLISHGIVAGIRWTSYSLPRDISMIVFLSILLYSVLLSVHYLLYSRKENRKTGGTV